jgi:hypothetical protein
MYSGGARASHQRACRQQILMRIATRSHLIGTPGVGDAELSAGLAWLGVASFSLHQQIQTFRTQAPECQHVAAAYHDDTMTYFLRRPGAMHGDGVANVLVLAPDVAAAQRCGPA